MGKTAFYTATGTGNNVEGKSWSIYPKGKGADYVQMYGHFIKGKVYMCRQSDKDDKIEVSGFFIITFVRQQFIDGRLIDYKDTPKQPGYYRLFFDAAQCKEFLKFERYETLQNRTNRTRLHRSR